MIVVDYSVEDYVKTLKILEANKRREFSIIEQALSALNKNIIGEIELKRLLENQHLPTNQGLPDLLQKIKLNNGKTGDYLDEIVTIQETYEDLQQRKESLSQASKLIDWIEGGLLFYATEIKNIPTPLRLFKLFIERQKVILERNDNETRPTINFFTKYVESDFWEELSHCIIDRETEIIQGLGREIKGDFFSFFKEKIVETELTRLLEENLENKNSKVNDDFYYCLSSPYSILKDLLKIKPEKKEKYPSGCGVIIKKEVIEMPKKMTLYSYLPIEALRMSIWNKCQKDESFMLQCPDNNKENWEI